MSSDAPTSQELLDALRGALGTQYTIERLLGQGGMGSVFLARDLTLDRPVAIKVINADVASNTTLRDRFLQEARTVARLRHANIVSVYSAGDANGLLYFAMEFVPGESLRDVLAREKTLTGERAERIIREVALALDHAHAIGLVHRDVKPENILIDQESGRAMLTDFGVARAFERDGSLTQTGMILGSPRYMSPEQASGDKAIDGRSDLYSLALVAYELYSGEPVVQSTTMAGMLVKHLTETPPPLATKAPDVPADIAAAIDKGLTKDPAARWQTGREFAEALAGHPIDSSGSVRAPRRAPKKRVSLWFAAAGLALAAIIGVVLNGRGAKNEATAYLVAPFEIQSGDQSVVWLREGSVNMLTMTLGQWSDLNVVDYERTLSLLDKAELGDKQRLSLDDAMRMARLANAGTVVTGQISTINDSLVVTARLYNARSGKQENQAVVSALLGADPRPLFDDLAQKLLELEGSGRTSTLQLAQATTTNLEAYRAYLNGVKLLNSWRLYEADTAFDRAIRLDSTFALAYHKKSLGLGWGDLNQRDGPADKAHALAGRLPPRERSLVQGHYHLIRALNAQVAQDTAAARTEFDASIKAYDDLFARGDTLVPEAWHGRADSYHHRRTNTATPAQLKEWTTQSLRGFSKTLAIDSTFHLAYAHLVELYNNAAAGAGILISGDSAIVFTDSASAARIGNERIQQLREQARQRGIEIARAWSRADDGSTRPFMQLANSYIAANQPDSALATMQAALSRPRSGDAAARLVLLSVQMSVGDTALGTTLREVLDRYTADTLRQVPVGQRFGLEGELLAASAMVGSARDLQRSAELFIATDPTLPTTTTPTKYITDIYTLILRIAMGEPVTPESRRAITASLKGMSDIPGGLGANVRSGSQSVPYLAYLATKDTTFLTTIRSWGLQQIPELDAMAALQRRDTAEAMRIARTFTPPAQLGDARFSMGGLRTIARAEVLAGLGLTRQAAETYDAIEPARINRNGLAEPGFAVWVRTWLSRARLWKELGERERAIAAYEEFLRRWKNADGPAARLVSEARQELGQLRDAR